MEEGSRGFLLFNKWWSNELLLSCPDLEGPELWWIKEERIGVRLTWVGSNKEKLAPVKAPGDFGSELEQFGSGIWTKIYGKLTARMEGRTLERNLEDLQCERSEKK